MPQQPNLFWKNLLEQYWKRNRVHEPESHPSLAVALFRLRELTKLSQPDIARWLQVYPSQYSLIESRGGPLNQAQFDSLIRLAREYSLPILAAYIESQKFLAPHKWNRKAMKAGEAGTLDRKALGTGDIEFPFMKGRGYGGDSQ